MQDDNLNHESTQQIKISRIMCLYLEFANKGNYTCRHLFRQRLQTVSITTDLQPRKLIAKETDRYLQYTYKCKQSICICSSLHCARDKSKY